MGGIHLWPGIALGASLVNWFVGAPALVALGMGTGNTLEAVVGASVLHWIGFRWPLERLRDVFGLIILAALLSTLISATLGVSSLYLGGVIQGGAFLSTWRAWWFGDVMGDLVVASFLLVWRNHLRFERVPLLRILELTGFALAVVMGTLFFLTDLIGARTELFPHPYLIFPLLMLVAVRLDQKWTVTSVLVVSAITLWATAIGRGRFQSESLSLRLFQAQIFLGVIATSKLVLAAAMMEHRQGEKENVRLYREAHDALLIRTKALRDSNGKLQCFWTVIRDLTERKKQGERFRTIVEAVPNGLILVDQKGQITLCNSDTEKMFG
jgi:integral membrane sensor domain MASE1